MKLSTEDAAAATAAPAAERGARAGKPAYYTATLGKGLDVLEALSAVEDAGLSELARRLEIATPTLFRILATLVARGFVEKAEDSGRYRLTLRSWELGARALQRLAPRQAALRRMEELARLVHESPHLAVLDGTGVVIVEKAECDQPVRVETYVGQRAPAHCSAIGKAILAFRDPQERARLLEETPARFTEQTLVEPEALEREFAEVRRLGYATNRGEWRAGVSAVAVPLYERDGGVRTALSLTMPTERFSEQRLQELLLPSLLRAAEAISRDLGGRGRP